MFGYRPSEMGHGAVVCPALLGVKPESVPIRVPYRLACSLIYNLHILHSTRSGDLSLCVSHRILSRAILYKIQYLKTL